MTGQSTLVINLQIKVKFLLNTHLKLLNLMALRQWSFSGKTLKINAGIVLIRIIITFAHQRFVLIIHL